jgi:drug/metabolite transporter (DMT)-like permease
MRIALDAFPPILMAGLRYGLAGAGLLVIQRLRGAALPTAAQWRSSAVVGLLLCSANAMVAAAEQWVSSGLAAVVIASVPLFVALISGAFGHWPQRRDWVGLAVGLSGNALLNLGGDLRGSPLGASLLVLSTLLWALGSVLARTLPLPSGLTASGAQMLCGGSVLVLAGLLHGDRVAGIPAARPLLAFVYLVLFGSMVAFSAYGYLLAKVRPALATSYAYVNPIVAVGLGALVLGERVTPLALGAMVLVLAGVALVALAKR